MTFQPLLELPKLDFTILDRELDRTKSRVFRGKNAAFLAPLMCNLLFRWNDKIETAQTNGVWIEWSPYYFHFLHQAGRESILVHELRHVALMHMLRRGTRDPRIWNLACDTVLDNQMDLEGYCVDSTLFPPELFPPSKTLLNHADYGTMAAEEIYDLMIKNPPPPPSGGGGGQPKLGLGQDLVEPSADDKGIHHQILNNVVSAVHAAKIAGEPGTVPGETEVTLKKFLSPKIPWEIVLHNFFQELGGEDYSWARPNRRYLGL